MVVMSYSAKDLIASAEKPSYTCKALRQVYHVHVVFGT